MSVMKGRSDEPSNADLVYDVLRLAERPLTFQEIFDRVNARRPVTTRNPKGTIRGALTQGRQLVTLGEGRYGYLPHLVEGSLLRLPLTEKKPARAPLVYPDELRQALWPSFLEIQKRSNKRPARLRLPGGTEVVLPLEILGPGTWGSLVPAGLRRYLIDERAKPGDALLIRVVDGEVGTAEAWLESRLERDRVAVAQRNAELADATAEILRDRQTGGEPTWDLVLALLARGAYRAEVAPDPLEDVLRADPRFEPAGLSLWLLSEQVTPAIRAEIRLREQAEASLMGLLNSPEPLDRLPMPLDPRVAMERTLADISVLFAEHEFETMAEGEAYLADLMAHGGIPHRTPSTPLEQAQELLYDAREAPTPRKRVALAKSALEISRDCADAYVILAEDMAGDLEEAAELYAKGVEAGERALGKEGFEEGVGHFWGIVETRPYMRARLGLAQVLWAMGRQPEAVAHLWDMLRLNPGDNQGVRDVLLGWLLDCGDDAEVAKLLDLYPDDVAANWLYGRALHAFRAEGASRRSRSLLAEARRFNPLVPAYLLGKKKLPATLPSVVGLGDEDEAIVCAAEQGHAWRTTSGALDWLRR